MNCSNCNQEIDNVEYCPHCGEKVEDEDNTSSKEEKFEPEEKTHADQEESQKGYTWKTNVAAFLLWWALVFTAYGTFMLTTGEQSGFAFLVSITVFGLLVYKSRIRQDGISYGSTGRKFFKAVLIAVFFFAGLWLFTTGSTNAYQQNNAEGTDVQTVSNLPEEVPSDSIDSVDQLNESLKIASNEMNERLPILSSDGIRFESMESGDQSMTYNYTLTDQMSSRAIERIGSGAFVRSAKRNACQWDSTKMVVDTAEGHDVQMTFKYTQSSGELVNEFTVNTEDCS
jgi:hypothetical protein